MKKNDFIILVVILIVALGLRLYKIDTPLADFNLIKPIYDDLSSIQSGIENPLGIRMVELPLYSAIFAFFFKYLPITTLEIYGRFTSVVFSLIIITVLYYFALKEKNRVAAIATG